MARLRAGPRRIGALVVTSFLLLGALSSCATTARISDVYMALDGQGNRRRNVFVTDSKEIHCIVEMGIGRKGVTVAAVLRQTQLYDFASDMFINKTKVLANAENSPEPQQGIQILDVVLTPVDASGMESMDAPFKPGRFTCEASLDGVLEKTTTFNIDFPDCPTSAITSGTLCFGFYKNLSVCPRDGLSVGGPPNCQCDEIKGWQCDP